MSPNENERLFELLSLQADGALDDAQWDELVALVSGSDEARRAYVQQMALHVMMYRIARSHLARPVLSDVIRVEGEGLFEDVATKSSAAQSPVLGFLGDVFRAGGEFLCRPPVLTLLLTVALPVVMLLVLWVHIKSQPIPAMPVAKQPEVQFVAPAAEIGRTHECVWEEPGDAPALGASLAAGRRLRLRKGFVELRFADGATVLLAGPSTFDTIGGGEGFLRSGALVATVSKQARGFRIQTPAAAVVDLGTEFGVSVDAAGGKEEVHVFQGEVVLETGPPDVARKPNRRHLTAGSAASIVSAIGPGEPTVQEIVFRADRYVRSLPPPAMPAQPAIVADFSGGPGTLTADQYPGTAGSGWAGGWSYRKTREATCSATVERNNPVLDGAD